MEGHTDLVLLALAIAVVGASLLARRLDVPYPIVLVVVGAVLGFVPGAPDVVLDPDLVLLVFLPPLLFNAAYFTSPADLRDNLRTIGFLSIGLVLITALAVAAAARAVVPGLGWAPALVLGAMVSPTDPLAATSMARGLGIPRRSIAVLEGESLVNDATALILYRTALMATVGTGIDAWGTVGRLVLAVGGGVAIGVVVGVVTIAATRRVAGDALGGVVVSLLVGYAAYLPADAVGASGVLAAVTAGLWLGSRSAQVSTPSGRLLGYSFWEVLVFLANAVLFSLVGLQLPRVLEALRETGTARLAAQALAVAAVVIGVRLIWVFTVPYLVRAIDRRPSQRARRAGWRPRLVLGWSGMRGSVSLATALALPGMTGAGAPFPARDLLVFLVFAVIAGTLVVQGLTLPALIRAVGIADPESAQREEVTARLRATEAALERLEELREQPWVRDDTAERTAGALAFRVRRLRAQLGDLDGVEEGIESRSQDFQRLQRELLAAQRDAVAALAADGTVSADVRHRVDRDLDLEEDRLDA